MSRQFRIGPDRHGTISLVCVSDQGCAIEVISPHLPCPVVSYGTRDEILVLAERIIADQATCPQVRELYRVVAAYLLTATANG